MFLQAHDKYICDSSENIIIQEDALGIKEDVRDIIISTKCGKGIGLSAKHNHAAVKHSRLSNSIDFGEKWTGYPCSAEYFKAINPVFQYLESMQIEKKLFKEIDDKENKVYLPVITAFKNELERLCESSNGLFVEKIFRYLLGNFDFYKVMLSSSKKDKEFVSIQSINIDGTLGYGDKWKAPDKISGIYIKEKSLNTLIVTFEGGWTFVQDT